MVSLVGDLNVSISTCEAKVWMPSLCSAQRRKRQTKESLCLHCASGNNSWNIYWLCVQGKLQRGAWWSNVELVACRVYLSDVLGQSTKWSAGRRSNAADPGSVNFVSSSVQCLPQVMDGRDMLTHVVHLCSVPLCWVPVLALTTVDSTWMYPNGTRFGGVDRKRSARSAEEHGAWRTGKLLSIWHVNTLHANVNWPDLQGCLAAIQQKV